MGFEGTKANLFSTKNPPYHTMRRIMFFSDCQNRQTVAEGNQIPQKEKEWEDAILPDVWDFSI